MLLAMVVVMMGMTMMIMAANMVFKFKSVIQ